MDPYLCTDLSLNFANILLKHFFHIFLLQFFKKLTVSPIRL